MTNSNYKNIICHIMTCGVAVQAAFLWGGGDVARCTTCTKYGTRGGGGGLLYSQLQNSHKRRNSLLCMNFDNALAAAPYSRPVGGVYPFRAVSSNRLPPSPTRARFPANGGRCFLLRVHIVSSFRFVPARARAHTIVFSCATASSAFLFNSTIRSLSPPSTHPPLSHPPIFLLLLLFILFST